MNILKKIFMPSGEQKAVDGVRSWTVKWQSYNNDSWSTYANKEAQAEVFTKIEDAEAFKKALEDSFRFTKSTVTNISIKENVQL